MNTANPEKALAMSQAKLLCDTMSTLAESPVWDERRQVLFWCDILGRTVRSAAIEPGLYREWAFPHTVSSLGLCRNGDLIVACGMDIVILDPDSGETRLLHSLPSPDGIPCRLNDGRIGPDGAFWVGTMHNVPLSDMEPHGELWRITEKSAERRQTGLTCPNGLAFSPDGSIMWQSDSVQKWIRRRKFDKRNGTFDEGVLVARMTEETGRPDGGCLDSSGTYYSAGVSAGLLNVFTPDGDHTDVIATPVPHPTMPCFGGPDFSILFLTSHRHNMSEDRLKQSPFSGGVWAIPTQRKGFAAFRFGEGG
ncbi:6-deoxy-6-sulfogluconolactonase [Rhizobium rhizogenes]|uniref:6-deoxy-6-sulfogluconolactonase n=1 Tax=Rhizobium rhizogenes TaxID=359 RepID=A0AAN2A5D5_RHIRH|nr:MULTISPECIES: SMP-30/gluconolactonase/LRE family protein [Rhizobium/Agrobacterium group]MCZ7444403.1 SMP-30/gluconolactonase/LRE family protein [Rhizobium rhizogenes]NSZ80749.1 SMP-30/gluconolactonase/LRE family protein [Agrobacterium tumefaciens]OAM62083.1 calcium-binding protein [Rhizobium rhizogenes]CAD0215047.1 6-deoxy-6-sulfogluconolactonase [Rhizobium rhizogenes]